MRRFFGREPCFLVSQLCFRVTELMGLANKPCFSLAKQRFFVREPCRSAGKLCCLVRQLRRSAGDWVLSIHLPDSRPVLGWHRLC
jgi:hypothetical protein